MPEKSILYRTLHPEVKIEDAKEGIATYIASDESIDSYREVIRADGWRFTNFAKNAPFVDSHEYTSIAHLLGKVIDFKVVGRKLIETVQWAKDVAENELARIGWKMTEAGFLKAVSVGFWPVKTISTADPEYKAQLKDLEIADTADTRPRAIYMQQEQLELSAVILGANPNALIARSYKAGVLNDAELETLSIRITERETANLAAVLADALLADQQARKLSALERIIAVVKTL